jgi:hypothetical protein
MKHRLSMQSFTSQFHRLAYDLIMHQIDQWEVMKCVEMKQIALNGGFILVS